MIHGTLKRDDKEYRVGDEVPGLSDELIKAYENIGMISVHRTTPEPVFDEPVYSDPTIDVVTKDDQVDDKPVTKDDWEDSEPVAPKPKRKKRTTRKRKP